MTMSTNSPEHSNPRSLIRYGFLWLAITIVALWAMYLIRSQLLLIYVCILFATGLSPLVRWIERRRASGRRRLPRPAAILVFYAHVSAYILLVTCAIALVTLARRAEQAGVRRASATRSPRARRAPGRDASRRPPQRR